MEWRFKKMSRDESRDKSCLVEFFNSDLFRDFTDALIREDLQNRLDAKRDDVAANEPVIVTYHLSTHDSQASAKIGKWLAPIEKHCNSKSCRETYHRPLLDCFSGAGQKLRYLTIECFNTTGLRGDPVGMDDEDLANDFYWMFRNQGRSGKPRLPGKRGSWGVGKVVYHLASLANTMFCYTITKDGFALMGKCQLVLPEAYRQILRARLFGAGMIDRDDIWLKFTAQFVSLNDLTDESTEAEKDVVIDLAVKTFCEHHQMIAAVGAGEEVSE